MLRIAGRTAGPKKKFQLFFNWWLIYLKYIVSYRVTHKGWDFRDDCTEIIWSYFIYLWFLLSFPFQTVCYLQTTVKPNQTNNSLDEWSLEITSIVPLNLFCTIHAIICLMMIIIWKPKIRSVCWQNKPKMSAWIKPMPLLDKGRLFCKIKAYSQWPAIMFQDKMKIEKLFWLLDRQLSTFSSSSFIY